MLYHFLLTSTYSFHDLQCLPGVSCGFGFFAWSGLRGLGVTAVTLGLLHITQLLESFDILKYGFFNTGGALSSISLSIERAPPLRNSPHTSFSFLD